MNKKKYKQILELYKKVARQHTLFIKILPKNVYDYSIDYYLFYRILDTVEDSIYIEYKTKIRLLDKIITDFESGIKYASEYIKSVDEIKPEYKILCENLDLILEFHNSLDNKLNTMIFFTGQKMAEGMKKYLIKFYDNDCFIKDFNELDEYCYYVAGIVGELNTEIFYKTGYLTQENYNKSLKISKSLGDYLQLVNIIRDHFKDYEYKNKSYFPESISGLTENEQLYEIIKFAESKENEIVEYISLINNRNIKKYCKVLYDIAKIHFDYYKNNTEILNMNLKPDSLKIFSVLPLKLKFSFLLYKLGKYVNI